uniref:Glycoside hydrolase family 31 protein n=1 Tax=Prevotella sp. GTC17262 TaxID=3236797 RepID=A0AB33JJV9_9BACT
MAQTGNVAYQNSNVRFTVITDGAVRMEYSPKGKFVDDKSFVAVNRSYAPTTYKVSDSKDKVVIKTTKFILNYKKAKGPFTKDNLSILSTKGYKQRFEWKPGTEDKQNLKGTYRTLDFCDGNIRRGEPIELENGLLSKSGWTFIDDSNSYLFDKSDWPWAIERPTSNDSQDWYFLAYGHDYKQALRDFTVFAGKVPLPPRYAFGYWWSRFWDYSDDDYRKLLGNFRKYDIPLDVLVVDMDWHYTSDGLGDWTGYTWNKRLFPAPEKFMQWLKGNDVKVTLNLHPANGIKAYEENYPALAKWMGLDPTLKKDIPWQSSNKRFMSGWMNTILRPLEKMGVDFWWPDWQQFPNDSVMKNLSNTWWINYVLFSDMQLNRNTRPMLYHRWGGLGNHRYQIGFSGDTHITWNSLDYQPYFNSTSSNVLYCYWSHDIGGHMQGIDRIDPEMYIRWMQFGMMSPILRTHSTKNKKYNKEPWAFEAKYADILRGIIHTRYALAPYIYTMARKTYDDALPLCRPMYYDYPESKEAYENKDEYMFGDNLLVYPITAPMNGNRAEKDIWLPAESKWYEVCSGTTFEGNQTIHRSFALDEMPVYVKSGAIIPLYDKVKNLTSNNDSIIVTVFPGNTENQFTLYEDAGNDKAYDSNFARTLLSYKRDGNKLVVKINARKGAYQDMSANRKFLIRLVASAVPLKAECDGTDIGFTYDGETLSVTSEIPFTDCSTEKTVTFTFADDNQCLDNGLMHQMKEVRNIVAQAKLDDSQFTITRRLGELDTAARNLSYHPENWKEIVKTFYENYANLTSILQEQGILK